MGIFFIVIGAVLIFFGMKFKIGEKKISDMKGGELAGVGCRSYLKVMMIIGGVAFILIGLIWSCAGSMM